MPTITQNSEHEACLSAGHNQGAPDRRCRLHTGGCHAGKHPQRAFHITRVGGCFDVCVVCELISLHQHHMTLSLLSSQFPCQLISNTPANSHGVVGSLPALYTCRLSMLSRICSCSAGPKAPKVQCYAHHGSQWAQRQSRGHVTSAQNYTESIRKAGKCMVHTWQLHSCIQVSTSSA